MKTIHLSRIDSTNTYLKENYKSLENFTFVSADSQTCGKGRNQRTWISEDSKNLLFSLLILDEKLISEFKKLSIVTAYSIITVLKEYGINNLSIKWPNDIYYKDEKICGILLEAKTLDKIECLIVGVGINVNQETFIGEYNQTPTSLKNILHKDIDIKELKEKIYKRLIEDYNSDNDFYEEIKEYDYLKNKNAYAIINDTKALIKVIGIDEDYSLKINKDNKIINIDSGEISFHINKLNV